MELQKFLRVLYRLMLEVLKYLLVILTLALVVIVFGNVVGRYLFNYSWPWADEASRFLFIWVILIGAVLTNEKYEHMNLDILVRWLPSMSGRILQITSQAVIVAVLAIIVRGGITATVGNLTFDSPALGVPYGLVYMIVPICCTIMIVQTIARMIRITRELVAENRAAN
ncbi:MAG TPA: TRAP transporter small permease [Spirochaetia bacterium]|nr:TRAP transporter small permease [Spirochaetia bacterium]